MTATDETIVIESLEGCARCGHTHAMLRFFKLDRSMKLTGGGFDFTHWAMCPNRREPIMMQASRLPSPAAIPEEVPDVRP